MSSNRVTIVLDATMLDMFLLCPARFNYRFNLNKTGIEKAKPLDRGTIVHVGCESYYGALAGKMKFDSAVETMVKSMNLAIASEECELSADDAKRTIDVMLENVTFWRTADSNLQIKQVEQSFIYELYSDEVVRIMMMGKIDLLCDDKISSNLPYDHKSYDREYPTKRLTNQFLNYANAVSSNYLIVNKIGFQKTLPPEQKFKRIPLSYDPLIIEQWKANTVTICMNYLNCAIEKEWPMNFTSCDKFNRLCEYFEVCDSSGDEAKIYKLSTNFKTVEPWDVSQSLSRKS